MSLLRQLFECRALAPALPFGEELAAVHVPFDELLGGSAREQRVAAVTDGGGMVLVVGDTGEGKSALVSCALSMAGGRLAVPPRRVSGAIDIKGVQVNVGDLLGGERTLVLREQIDVAHQAAEAFRAGGLAPVLVLDDTDKWSRTPDRIRAGRAFFDDALDAVIQLGLPVVANAHPRYFDGADLPDKFDAKVVVGRVDGAGLRQILARRIEVATEGAAQLDHAFEPAAVERIVAEYDTPVPIRRIVQIASEAVIEAVEAALERVTVGAVEAALDVVR